MQTPQEIEQMKKMEGVFLPYSRVRRETLFGNRTSARFVHYTTAEAALKIITRKRLWLRNSTCMSDYREVQHGFTMLQRYFADKDASSKFSDAVNSCAAGAADKAFGWFNSWWPKIQFGTYIASLSEHEPEEDLHGRLSMWRAYGGTAGRVAIVFDVPTDSNVRNALNILFSPVAYLDDHEAAKVIPEVLNNIQQNREFLGSVGKDTLAAWIFNMLLIRVTCSKHRGFREEKEWRVVYHSPRHWKKT